MKTFQQFNEDVDRLTQRRQQLRQRQLKQMAAHKEKVAAYQEAQRRKRQKEAEREELKKEIKRELQTEQVPYGIKQSPYTQGIVKRTQARMISAPSKHRANVIKRLAKSSHYGDHHKYY